MNSASMQCYGFDDKLVRVVMKNGEPWFVAADICRILGVRDASEVVEKLDDDEKSPDSIRELGDERGIWIVSESGLYTIILRSRAATTPGSPAHRFRKWVTGEVIPSIRKTGGYAAVEADDSEEQGLTIAEDRNRLDKLHYTLRTFGPAAAREMWLQLGLPVVPAMAKAMEAIKTRAGLSPEKNETIKRFVTERIEVVPDVRMPAHFIYTAYCQWCIGKDMTPVGQTFFAQLMELCGFRRKKSSRMYYLGLRLKPEASPTAS